MYQIGLIFGVLALRPQMGIYGLGWGVLIGASLHLLVQIPLLLRLKGTYTPILGLENANVREVGRLMLPRLLGVAAVQLNFWVNTRLASRMVEGSVTGIVLAFALMLMPQAAIAQSIAIAAMPTFSAQVALGKFEEMRLSLASSLRGVLLLAIPASVGLILLRQPLVTLLYQRGEFDAFSTQLVAWALLWYAAGLIGHSLVEITARAFYALHDTKTPVLVGIAAMGLNMLFSVGFALLFAEIGWMPLGGLALANSLATALEAIALLVMMRRRLGGLHSKKIALSAVQGMIASLVMALGLWVWMGTTTGQPTWIVVAGGLLLGGSLYAFVMLLLRVEEAQLLARAITRRVGKKA